MMVQGLDAAPADKAPKLYSKIAMAGSSVPRAGRSLEPCHERLAAEKNPFQAVMLH